MEPSTYRAEIEQLECQRERLLDLMIHERLSPELERHVRSLLDDVLLRILTMQSEQQTDSDHRPADFSYWKASRV